MLGNFGLDGKFETLAMQACAYCNCTAAPWAREPS